MINRPIENRNELHEIVEQNRKTKQDNYEKMLLKRRESLEASDIFLSDQQIKIIATIMAQPVQIQSKQSL